MKKLIVLIILITSTVSMGRPNLLAYLGLGSYGLGISKEDPLGVPAKIHDRLMTSGFSGDLGKIGKPRTIKYIGNADSKNYPNVKGEIQIVIGEDEYIQKIQGVYLNTQHQMSAQKNTATGAFMSSLWGMVFSGKPKFERRLASQMNIPHMGLPGKLKINTSAMTANAKSDDVTGIWEYSEDSMGEAMVLKLAN